jgi:endonuclease/exonuclease/phosphatase (EEP) superfamily protein YafD
VNPDTHRDDDGERRRTRFLRRRSLLCAASGTAFLAGCVGVLGLLLIYFWPRANVPVYYFTVRPAFVWFAGIAPLVGLGVFGVRLRWFAAGCAFWAVGLCATGEVLQALKPFEAAAAERFVTDRMGFRAYLSAAGGAPPGEVEVPLRVVSWNMRGGAQGAEEAVAQLADLDPDIALAQEFGHASPRRVLMSLQQSDAFRGYAIDGWRMGIVSRFPIEPVEAPTMPADIGSVWRVRVGPGLYVICMNCHLTPLAIKTQLLRGWSWDGLREAVRQKREELEAVRKTLELFAREGTVILAGDFNLPPCYADLRAAVRGFRDCFAENGFGWGKTGPPRLPALRVDQIYVPRGTRVYRTVAVPTRFSDHFPVVAEVAVSIAPTGLGAQGHERTETPPEGQDGHAPG